ncbi:MAG: GspH/FimT family pseudopilin [Smithella sp.]|jgi:prepilin-type N-terminal cleavage/methylation domain-containing protein
MVILRANHKDLGIKGFTLVELIVVIAIIAVLLTISPSMFTAFRQRTNLREAAGALAEGMKLAKQRAVAENVNYTVTFDINNNSYEIKGGTYDVTKKLSDFGSGISILSQNYSGGNSGAVTFQTRGTCNLAGTVTLKNILNSQIAITTNTMGRVTTN